MMPFVHEHWLGDTTRQYFLTEGKNFLCSVFSLWNASYVRFKIVLGGLDPSKHGSKP